MGRYPQSDQSKFFTNFANFLAPKKQEEDLKNMNGGDLTEHYCIGPDCGICPKKTTLPAGNCPYCDSAQGFPSAWGLHPNGWTELKEQHDKGHPGWNRTFTPGPLRKGEFVTTICNECNSVLYCSNCEKIAEEKKNEQKIINRIKYGQDNQQFEAIRQHPAIAQKVIRELKLWRVTPAQEKISPLEAQQNRVDRKISPEQLPTNG